MRGHECHEGHRIASLASLNTSDEQHLASCDSCREFLLVNRALTDLATESSAVDRMPAADIVFVRARILEKKRAAIEIEKPLRTFQNIAAVILLACWIGFVAIQWSPFLSWLGGLEVSTTSGIESNGSLPLSFFWMLAVLSVMTMMTLLHDNWTEEHAL